MWSNRCQGRLRLPLVREGGLGLENGGHLPLVGSPAAPRPPQPLCDCPDRARAAVEQKGLLGQTGSEFLEVFEAVSAAPETFTQVWSEPLAYAWTRGVSNCSISSCSGGAYWSPWPPTSSASGAAAPVLEQHLEQLEGFVLGIAVLDGTECRFREPFRPTLPFAIPGTRGFWKVPLPSRFMAWWTDICG